MSSELMPVEQPIEPDVVLPDGLDRDLQEREAREEWSWRQAFSDWWASRSPNTRRTYASQWRSWVAWCREHDRQPMPADPLDLVEFIHARGRERKADGAPLSRSSMTQLRSAIGGFHKAAVLADPTDDPRVKLALAATRKDPARQRPPKQAKGMSLDDIARITQMADLSERLAERPDATYRELQRAEADRFDLAMIEMQFSAGLRRSEAAAVTWSDLEQLPNGTGALRIQRSKTDQLGEGQVKHIGEITLRRILRIRPEDAKPSDPILGGIVGSTISSRIQRCAARAGLGEGYSGHSCRVGMAQELVANGASTAEIMQEGRWDSPAMVARYTQKLDAGRGAMARLQRERRLE